MHINSIRFKTSILYSVILAIVLSIFACASFLNIKKILYRDMDNSLKIKADEIIAIVKAYTQIRNNNKNPINEIFNILKHKTGIINDQIIIDDLWKAQFKALNLTKDYINIMDITGNSLFISNNFNTNKLYLLKKQVPILWDKITYKNIHKNTIHLRIISMPIRFYQTKLIVQIATSLKYINTKLDYILWFSIFSIILLLVLTSFIGNIFANQILQPVQLISDAANKITYKDLTSRLTSIKTDKEMKTLINSFNMMINRLEKSFTHINEFSSHVAHELKTPLAIMKGEIEIIFLQDRPIHEYKAVLIENLEEIDRMIIIIRDLLLLSRIEYKSGIFNFNNFDFLKFINEIFEQSKILTKSKDINYKLNVSEKKIIINGDKIHLRRLFFNIINNAVSYTPPQGKINISVEIKNKNVCVEIADTGKGISKDNLLMIFNKFFRVPDKEKKSISGSGLGLNIALSIAKIHQGNITVKSELKKGTIFTVYLPLAIA